MRATNDPYAPGREIVVLAWRVTRCLPSADITGVGIHLATIEYIIASIGKVGVEHRFEFDTPLHNSTSVFKGIKQAAQFG